MASWLSPLQKLLDLNNKKTLIAISSGIVIGCSLYSYLTYRHKRKALIDEGFEETVRLLEEIQVKRILVLGLNGSGKSSFLNQLSRKSTIEDGVEKPSKPTEGFNVVSVNTGNGLSLNFWEIGGSKDLRTYWSNFLQDTDVLVFMVDSSHGAFLSDAIKELHFLAADERLNNVPIVILANKQDQERARTPETVAKEFSLDDLQAKGHKVKVLGLQVPPSETPHSSVHEAKALICQLLGRKSR